MNLVVFAIWGRTFRNYVDLGVAHDNDGLLLRLEDGERVSNYVV